MRKPWWHKALFYWNSENWPNWLATGMSNAIKILCLLATIAVIDFLLRRSERHRNAKRQRNQMQNTRTNHHLSPYTINQTSWAKRKKTAGNCVADERSSIATQNLKLMKWTVNDLTNNERNDRNWAAHCARPSPPFQFPTFFSSVAFSLSSSSFFSSLSDLVRR